MVFQIRLLICTVIILMLGACATSGSNGGGSPRDHKISDEQWQQFTRGRPAAFHGYYATVLKQGERNAVLNYLRLGLELLKHGEFAHAGDAFDQAIRRIETIYADNDQARRARSKFTAEYVKDFKGDPYERAMAYFYRGLIFLEYDDYENARAAMLGGLEQDAMAEDADYAKDFALFYYLAGWASQCNGDVNLARDLYEQAYLLNDQLKPPREEANLLYLAFINSGPAKMRTGEHKEKLYYVRSWTSGRNEATRDRAIALAVNDRPVPLAPAEDIYFQAATRGGRAVDVINAGKAEFKASTEALGEALTSTGVATMAAASRAGKGYNRDMGYVGAGLAVLGAISSIASRSTKPAADIRYWDNLPEFIQAGAAIKRPGDAGLDRPDLRITLFDAQGDPVEAYINVAPFTYSNRISGGADCDWIGMEPYKRPLPTEHVNR